MTKECLICKKEYTDSPSKLKNRKYCSIFCKSRTAIGKKPSEKQLNALIEGRKLSLKTEIRQKAMATRKAKYGYINSIEARKKQSIYRSKNTGWKHRKDTLIKMRNTALNNKNWSKGNNPSWEGGISPINQRIRSSTEYKLWRKAVLERDNYTCIWCFVKDVPLQADHIKPFAYFPELRFAIDNGRTLCVPCHKTTDTYGRMNITNNKMN